MFCAALAVVLVHVTIFGPAREADERTASHLWHLLMAGHRPIVAFFAIKWLPQYPRQALRLPALQIAAAMATSLCRC